MAIKGVTRGGNPSGTSLRGEVTASYAEIVEILGEPDVKLTSKSPHIGDGKCSTEWVLTCGGYTFTVYDYKETSLYDSDLPSPDEFRAQPSYSWHIGGRRAEPFMHLLEEALADLRARTK